MLGGSEDLQGIMGDVGAMAGSGLAFVMGLYDNPGKSTAKQAVKTGIKPKPNKAWKEKIHGKPQVTGRAPKDKEHAFISVKEAVRAAKREDVTYVQMDLGVNRMLPKDAKLGPKGNRRPDVAYQTKDGRIHQIEVQSRTDKPKALLKRMENTGSKFPENMQGGRNRVIKRKFE